MILSQISVLLFHSYFSWDDGGFPSSKGRNPLNNTPQMTDSQELAHLFHLHWPLCESREMLEPFRDGHLTQWIECKRILFFWWCTGDQRADVEGNFLDGVLSEEMFPQWLQGQEFSSGGDRVQGKPSVICNSAKHCQFPSSLNKKTGFHSNLVQADRSWQNF